ncbi:MAG: DUF6174 domain-containing protein [Deinococcales bacterium]
MIALSYSDGSEITSENQPYFLSIEGLFEELAKALAKPEAVVEVSYDADLGYPESLSIDPIPQAIDDEVYFKILSFEGL